MIGAVLASGNRSLDLTSFGNCACWIDASDASTITQSGGSVSRIDDKSGSSRHWTQGTSANQARIDTATQNGLTVLDFDGVNDRFVISLKDSLGKNVAGLTLHVVCRIRTPFTGTSPAPIVHLANGIGSTQARVSLAVGNTAFRVHAGGRRLDADSSVIVTDSAAYPGGFAVYSVVFDYANSELRLYVNGTIRATDTNFQTDGNTSDTNCSYAAIGSDALNVGFDGQIGEAAIFHEAQSEGIVANIASCLLRKWGMPEELGHITWQTPVDIGTGTACLDTPAGQVVEYGWRFTSVSGTVNSIVFAEASCENESGEETSGLYYTNSDSTLQALLNSFEYKTSTTIHTNHLRIRLTGLTKGVRYAVQLFAVDKRTSSGNRNQRFLDGYGNESASVQMNAEKYVVGEFVASGPTQLVMVKYISGGPSDAAVINLLVLRRFV